MASKKKKKSSVGSFERRTCGAMQIHHRLLETDPQFRSNQIQIERECRECLRRIVAPRLTPYRIPVVVHVVYDDKEGNIGDEQIHSQIKRLSTDFRALNDDRNDTPSVWAGLVADCNIEFYLADKDPAGDPTDGITRTKSKVKSFGDDDSIKRKRDGGANAWPTERYLNIWVGNLSGGILGYAQFPGGPSETDGVVILQRAFGVGGTTRSPFDLGRTTTHEVGHFLNLRHIWGDTEDCSGTDFVDDTPRAETANYGRPDFPHITCSNGPHGDMYMNYMDYVDDATMVMFTAGQALRMQATLEGPRSNLVSAHDPQDIPLAVTDTK